MASGNTSDRGITFLDYLNLVETEGPGGIEPGMIDGIFADHNGLRRTDWYDDETLRSLTSAERAALKESPAEWTEDAQGYFLRWPCTLEDLRRALGTSVDAINEEVAIEYGNATSTAAQRPLKHQRFQEQEILRALRMLGFDPLALPARTPGARGVKAAIRSELTDPMWQGTVFDAAWKRLRKSGGLKEV